MARKLKSPEQVCRIDGRGAFMELLTIGLGIDKVALNFVSYDTGAAKGSRVSSSVMVYLGVHDAEVFADNVLSGKMAKAGQAAKKLAADKGYKYAKEVFCSMTGTPASRSTRSDGAAMSRQLKLTPGSKQPWVLSAESGPGREEGTGIIAPAYPGGKPECIIRIPLSDDALKSLALSIRSLVNLWYRAKFLPVAQEEIARSKTLPAFALNKGKKSLVVDVSAMAIDQLVLRFNGGQGTMYLSVSKAAVLANDILSGRLSKLSAANTDTPAYITYGGGKKGNGVYCRTFSVSAGLDGTWVLHTESGKGQLSDDGRILPDYDKPDRSANVTITDQELRELAHALRGMGNAWMEARYLGLVEEPIKQAREATEQELAALRGKAETAEA